MGQCDRCIQQAQAILTVPTGIVLLCGHHARDVVMRDGWEINYLQQVGS